MDKGDIFYFRNFSMQQAASGQRVNTDSCVVGAVVGEGLSPQRILDIGCGSGVLSLMFAERFPSAHITAVEPEPDIAAIAQHNFTVSSSLRISLLKVRAQDLSSPRDGKFDFVVCNPPYFQNSSLSTDRLRAVARHTVDLSPADLFEVMARMMSPDGTGWLSYPSTDEKQWLRSADAMDLYVTRSVIVRDYPEARPHMTIVGVSRIQPKAIQHEEITYRVARQGTLSPWMFQFRERWYPAHYNVQFYKT